MTSGLAPGIWSTRHERSSRTCRGGAVHSIGKPTLPIWLHKQRSCTVWFPPYPTGSSISTVQALNPAHAPVRRAQRRRNSPKIRYPGTLRTHLDRRFLIACPGSRSAAVRPATPEWAIPSRRSLPWSVGCGTNGGDREGVLRTGRCCRAVRGTCPGDLRAASGSQSAGGLSSMSSASLGSRTGGAECGASSHHGQSIFTPSFACPSADAYQALTIV